MYAERSPSRDRALLRNPFSVATGGRLVEGFGESFGILRNGVGARASSNDCSCATCPAPQRLHKNFVRENGRSVDLQDPRPCRRVLALLETPRSTSMIPPTNTRLRPAPDRDVGELECGVGLARQLLGASVQIGNLASVSGGWPAAGTARKSSKMGAMFSVSMAISASRRTARRA